VLSRQNLPVLSREGKFAGAANVLKGGYIYVDAENQEPEVILVATGSEVQIAVAAREELEASGVATRVVSMPCVEWFNQQSQDYKNSVLPHEVKHRVSIEAGLTSFWREIVGDHGMAVGIDHYGASADHKTLYKEFGITTEAVVASAKKLVRK
jgi:transketolase